MELKVMERLVLLSILPVVGDFTSLKIVRKLREDLSFNDEEHTALHFETLDGGKGLKWEISADIPKEVEIGRKATEIIVEALTKLNSEKKLEEHHFSIYEKFIGDE